MIGLRNLYAFQTSAIVTGIGKSPLVSEIARLSSRCIIWYDSFLSLAGHTHGRRGFLSHATLPGRYERIIAHLTRYGKCAHLGPRLMLKSDLFCSLVFVVVNWCLPSLLSRLVTRKRKKPSGFV